LVDHADNLVLVDVQVEIVQRAQAAEGQADLLELKRAGRQITSTRRVPSSPCGRAPIVTIRIAPIMI